MNIRTLLTCICGAAALAGCAVAPPTAPRVMALPGQNKDFATFQREDAYCRDYGYGQSGGAAAAQQASNSSVTSGLLGTAIGAGAGAALGSIGGNAGAGALVGGLGGAAVGSSIGASNAQISAGEMQRRYDMAYAQCMVSYGNTVQNPPVGYVAPGPGYYAPGYYAAPPPVVVAPSVGFGYYHGPRWRGW